MQWSAFQVLVNKTKWLFINDSDETMTAYGGSQIIVDLHEFTDTGGSIDGIRYAWNDHPCCGTLNTAQFPCPMNSC